MDNPIITDEKLYLHSISDHVIFGCFLWLLWFLFCQCLCSTPIALQDVYACARLLLDLSLPPGYMALLEFCPPAEKA